jgi:hypothetical protein
MNNTATAGVRDRVTEVLRRHYKDEAWLARSATGGYGATVTAGQHRERLPQYAATLREAGFLVADHSARGRLYVRDHGREHDVAMAREVAGILRSAYDEHARAHG